MKIILRILLFLFAISSSLIAAPFDLVTDLGTSAQTIGIGDVRGFNDTSSVIFENPAGLTGVPYTSVSSFTTKIINEVDYLNYAFSIHITRLRSRVGFAYMTREVDGLPLTKDDGNNQFFTKIGDFSYASKVTKMAIQTDVRDSISLGLGVNYFDWNLYNVTGRGGSLDVGAFRKGDRLSLSVVGENVLSRDMQYSNGGIEEIPRRLRASSKLGFGPFNLYGQYLYNQVLASTMSGGVSFHPGFISILSVRGGYKQYPIDQTTSSGFTMGLSLHLSGLSIDYALEKADVVDLNYHSYVSFGLNIFKEKPRKKKIPFKDNESLPPIIKTSIKDFHEVERFTKLVPIKGSAVNAVVLNINGVIVPLQEEKEFTYLYSMPEQVNEAEIVYTATNKLGQKTIVKRKLVRKQSPLTSSAKK